MAITTSAKKALRQNNRHKAFNERRSRAMKNAVKAARGAAKAGGEAAESISAAYQAIDKAAKRGLIKKNNASRKKSHIAKLFAAKA